MSAPTYSHVPKLVELHDELGIPNDYLALRELPIFEQGDTLVWMDGCDGPYQMEPTAAKYWESMRHASMTAGIEVFLVSAFRSYDYQAQLIRNKLNAGEKVCDVLTVVAPPGCSQHHTGRAIDLGTPSSERLEEDFETTAAFRWLTDNAHRYGFEMPFGRENPHGFIYEPWHWHWAGFGNR